MSCGFEVGFVGKKGGAMEEGFVRDDVGEGVELVVSEE